jgi:hypothetical protein
VGKGPKISHFATLSTPVFPGVPEEERDIPNPPELVRAVLSHDGYFCRIPGCGKLAEECPPIRWRRHGGKTTPEAPRI